MKKYLIVFLLALIVNKGYSQGFEIPPQDRKLSVSVGVSGGVNMSGLTSPGSDINFDTQMKIGYNVGATVNMRFLKRNERSSAKTGILAIQPEFRYATMGGKVTSIEQSLDLTYIMIPVMFQVYPIKSMYIEFGPVPSLNIAHNPEIIKVNNTEYDLSTLKANDVMLAVGIGCNFNGLNIGFRYNLGMSELAPNFPLKNSLIQINIGYLLQLGK